MDAQEFEKAILFALEHLTDQDIERIKKEVGVNTDYEIDEDGFTHIYPCILSIKKSEAKDLQKTPIEKQLTNDYVFDNVNFLAGYIKKILTNPTLIKIQKSLYFLWAFYAATYGNINYGGYKSEEFGLQPHYPRYLFKAVFEAQQYGAIINSVYEDYKNNRLVDIGANQLQLSMSFPETAKQNKREVLLFINNMLSQIDKVNDFGLIHRARRDLAWKGSFAVTEGSHKMDNEQIKKEYIQLLTSENKL